MKEDLKLHLGCGKRYIPGFIHIDIANFDHIDYRISVDNLSVIESNSCSLIYASHVFAYFDRSEAIGVIKEWYRVLRPGGLLRMAVPDFRQQVKLYEITENLDRLLGGLYGRMEIEIPGEKKTVYLKTVYDFPSLKRVLENGGFMNVRHYNWRETIHRDYDDYSQAYFPHMDKNGFLTSLNVEADKPEETA